MACRQASQSMAEARVCEAQEKQLCQNTIQLLYIIWVHFLSRSIQ